MSWTEYRSERAAYTQTLLSRWGRFGPDLPSEQAWPQDQDDERIFCVYCGREMKQGEIFEEDPEFSDSWTCPECWALEYGNSPE